MLSETQVVGSIYLLDFYERRHGLLDYIGEEELVTIISKAEHNVKMGICPHISKMVISNYLFNACPITYGILAMRKGKISIFGADIALILRNKTSYVCPSNLNLYIHSCTPEEANIIIEECKELFRNKMKHNRERNSYYTVEGFLPTNIEISCYTFKNRQEVLSGFDKNGDRFGWDYEIGFFCTISAALTFSFDVFPPDLLCVTPPSFCDKSSSKMHSRRYFDKRFSSSEVGISHNRYVAFANCRKEFNIPHDIFRLLCSLWLEIEVYELKESLLLKLS